MSSFARNLLVTALIATICGSAAGAQLIGGAGLPQVGIPSLGNVPVVSPVLQNMLGSPELQRQVIAPTLDSVAGLPAFVAESGSATLEDLRRLRLQELIRQNRAVLEADEHGLPVRRG